MEEATIKKTKWLAAGLSSIYILFIACGVLLIFLKGTQNIYPMYIVNISLDIYGMLLGYILFICIFVDERRSGTDHRYFLYLVSVAFMGLFTDLVAWIVDAEPRFRIINIIDNTAFYMCMPMACYFFFRYVVSVVKAEDKLIHYLSLIFKIGMIISLAAKILNAFTGMYFTVDESGVYSRQAMYPLSMVYMYMTLAATVVLIIRHRKQLRTYQIAVMFLYIFGPTVIGVLTTFAYGLSVNYAVVMSSLLLMYCLINLEQSKSKAIADRELSLATGIQSDMLPHIFPAFPERSEFDIFATMTPAKEVGGDFYDFYLIDDNHLCMTMADVSGKGVPAALFMMMSKIILANNAMEAKSPAKILEDTNNAICANNREQMFVTVWIGILEISTGKIIAANGGHEYPVIKNADGDYELFKDKHGLVIGSMEGMPYTEYEITLTPGSRLFIYTDGVPEATNANGELFGFDRMVDALNTNLKASPREVLDNVRTAVDGFVKEAEQFDDLTMLCLEYKGIG